MGESSWPWTMKTISMFQSGKYGEGGLGRGRGGGRGWGQKLECLSQRVYCLFCTCSRALRTVCCSNSLIVITYPGLSQSSGEKYHYERYSEISERKQSKFVDVYSFR